MPKSYSGDLRERVIEAVETGASRSEAAECFEISPNSAVKWLQAWHDHGVCAPKPRGGSRSVLEDYAERILDLIAEYPDRTLDELVVAMLSDGFRAAAARSGVFSIGMTSLLAAEQHRADVARAGRRWVRQQEFLDTIRLVFLDETATSTNMVRLRGRCPRGVRLIGHVLQGPWKTMTFVAALRLIRW